MADAPHSSRHGGRERVKRVRIQKDCLVPDDAHDPFATGRRPAPDVFPDEEDTFGASVPRLTLPTTPSVRSLKPARRHHEDTGHRRTLIAGATGRQPAIPQPYDDDAFEDTSRRRREVNSSRPPERDRRFDSERQLVPAVSHHMQVPELAAYRPSAVARRSRMNTRALVRAASSPWSRARFVFALLAISLAIWTSLSAAGEPSQPLMSHFQPSAGAHDSRSVASLVEPETQGMRPDLYDSNEQFNDWWDAACSAAVMSEVLTGWGVPNTTIGRMIDTMQPDISLDGGLLRPEGFQRGAAAFGYRADLNWHLTYQQMLYITNTLGLPIIVNVRIAYGYYHFFSGGHFLVMTGGDAQGLKIVDSSEYYIKYLPIDTFNSMFTGLTAVVVPQDYHYTLPNG